MFSQHGFAVSDRAYLLHYFVKDKTDPAIEVKFASHVDRVEINVDALADKLADMIGLLNDVYPGHNPNCDKCAYYDGREVAKS